MITAKDCAVYQTRLFGILVVLVAAGVAGREAGAADTNRTAQSGAFTKADFDKHVEQLQKKIPSKDFTVIVTPPFVVIGDESPEMVRRRSEGTVQWAVEKLKKAYFKRDPRQILDIWLFKDEDQLQDELQTAFWQDARYAVWLFLAGRRGPGDEYLDRWRNVGA